MRQPRPREATTATATAHRSRGGYGHNSGETSTELLELHAGQFSAYRLMRRHRRTVLRAGRRFGKTKMLETVHADWGINGMQVGWFAPKYSYVNPSFSYVLDVARPFVSYSNKTEHIIEFRGGGLIEFWSLEDENAGRSRSYDRAVVDEASLVDDLQERVDKSIRPTLLDRGGSITLAGTPKGIDPDNYFYLACTSKELGWVEFHAPTHANPTLDPEEVARLPQDYPPLVYQQEFLAEFVDWSGAAFFSLPSLLGEDGQPVEPPPRVDAVLVTLDTAVKTGRENDGTAAVYWAYSRWPQPRVWVVDWDIVQVEGAMLEVWLPGVIRLGQQYAEEYGARAGFVGVHVEDKASGMILIQQGAAHGWPTHAIDSKLTAVGKDERAISVSGYVYRGQAKLTRRAYDKIVNYKGDSANHFLKQVVGFHIGVKDQADDLLDAFCYGVAITLGNSEGF